eukprot:7238582-Karenia_brevis.AAC.1
MTTAEVMMTGDDDGIPGAYSWGSSCSLPDKVICTITTIVIYRHHHPSSSPRITSPVIITLHHQTEHET